MFFSMFIHMWSGVCKVKKPRIANEDATKVNMKQIKRLDKMDADSRQLMLKVLVNVSAQKKCFNKQIQLFSIWRLKMEFLLTSILQVSELRQAKLKQPKINPQQGRLSGKESASVFTDRDFDKFEREYNFNWYTKCFSCVVHVNKTVLA